LVLKKISAHNNGGNTSGMLDSPWKTS